MSNSNAYETVIGLEVHVQLSTNTKIFCGCSTRFGAKPNSQVCSVCLGLPGTLPVLNEKAFEYAIKVALALNCEIQRTVKFDRKNYYYPDLPKNYQISQYDMPIAYNGSILIEEEKDRTRTIGITRAHLEEDAGKLLHDENEPYSYVDLNRTGTPLLEIVSEPEIRTPEEAYCYLITLKQIVKYLGVSDCNMEEGSLRCDANISLREKGCAALGVKVEIKNLNSFKAVRDSLSFEQNRQSDALDNDEKIVQETRLWDEHKSLTVSMRQKEEAHDYRYFPEPDLVPFEVSSLKVEEIRKRLPELPKAKIERFLEEYKLKAKDAEDLTMEKDIADFYECTVKYFNNPQIVCNWIKGEMMRHLKEKGKDITEINAEPEDLAKIIEMVETGYISGLSGKTVLEIYIKTGRAPLEIVKEKTLEQVSDAGELEGIVLEVINENEKSTNDYKNGKLNALSFLVGQVMKKSRGKANPKLAGDMIKEVIDSR
ncbi:MAG: Asp-tRNA(Asn)/Glu-tRNA(Gln) amidotransferase subunit GatB [Candidatus Omnitrophota bacterium]